MALTNSQVAQAFKDGKVAQNHGMLSTGESLLSYGWWQFAKWVDGEIIIRKGRSYSTTTATKHRPQVYGYGREASEETPVNQPHMNS